MSFGSYQQDDHHTKIPQEYDNGLRRAKFFLFTRPIENSIIGGLEDVMFHHWQLIAVFEDQSYRTMDAGDNNGYLLPSYLKVLPKDEEPSMGKYFALDELNTTPLTLHRATVNNPLNGTKYSIRDNNCQKWVKNCAEIISSKLLKTLKEFNGYNEVNIIKGTAKFSFASSKSSLISSSRSASVRYSLLNNCNFNSSSRDNQTD